MKLDTQKVVVTRDSTISIGAKVYKHTTVETIKYNGQEHCKGLCECPLLLHIIWPVTIFVILIIFHRRVSKLIDVVLKRIEKGDNFKAGGFELSHNEVKSPFNTVQENRVLKIDELLSDESGKFPLNDVVAKKILSTLWKGQKQYDKSNNNRWTFIITGNSDFDTAMNRLLWRGLVAFDATRGTQYFLTDVGIEYCRKYENVIGDFSYFDDMK
jgi:hypothetical protein